MFVVILQVKVVEITEKIIDNANYNACSSRNTAVTVLIVFTKFLLQQYYKIFKSCIQ